MGNEGYQAPKKIPPSSSPLEQAIPTPCTNKLSKQIPFHAPRVAHSMFDWKPSQVIPTFEFHTLSSFQDHIIVKQLKQCNVDVVYQRQLFATHLSIQYENQKCTTLKLLKQTCEKAWTWMVGPHRSSLWNLHHQWQCEMV